MKAPPQDWSQPDVWPAPAKINLGLRITGQRADGYHELQTVFQLLGYGDSLRFVPDDSHALRIDTPIGTPDSDLCIRAASVLQARAAGPVGVRIERIKRLPIGAGLGGGSSNAATSLLALNQLWNLNIDLDELADIGAGLGADVPVFVRGQTAFAEGIGERLQPVDTPGGWFLVVTPPISVSTAEIFADPKLTRGTAKLTIPGFLAAPWSNDCEARVSERYPQVADVLAWLRARGQGQLTGTGASCYAPCASRAAAEALLAELQGRWPAFVAQALAVSPVVAHG